MRISEISSVSFTSRRKNSLSREDSTSIHFLHRTVQRAGVYLEESDIVRQIQNNELPFVENQDQRTAVYDYEHGGNNYKIIYDVKLKQPVTILYGDTYKKRTPEQQVQQAAKPKRNKKPAVDTEYVSDLIKRGHLREYRRLTDSVSLFLYRKNCTDYRVVYDKKNNQVVNVFSEKDIKKSMRKHFMQTCLDLAGGYIDEKPIVDDIQNQKLPFIGRQGKSISFFAYEHKGKQYKIAYDKNRHQLIELMNVDDDKKLVKFDYLAE